VSHISNSGIVEKSYEAEKKQQMLSENEKEENRRAVLVE